MNDFQDNLCAKIKERIKVRGYCVVYDSDLCRLASPLADFRKRQIGDIQAYAAENGFAVTIRDTGLNATFTMIASLPHAATVQKAT
jgi:hypothetical protein